MTYYWSIYLTLNVTATMKCGLDIQIGTTRKLELEYTVSYSQFMVSMAVSLAVCEISSVKDGVTLNTALGVIPVKVIENDAVR